MKRTNRPIKRITGIWVRLLTLLAVAVVIVFPVVAKAATPVQSIRIVLSGKAGPVAKRASELLAREITERSNSSIVAGDKAALTVELAVKPGIGTEGFSISDGKNGVVAITGNDENGLLYGVGKFLHNSDYGLLGFIPGQWRGTSVPKCTLRGMHMDTHFNNWYEASNDAGRKRYIEDMALWGENVLIVLFPSPWLQGFDDPLAKESIRCLNRMMLDAKAVGMKVGLTFGNDMGFRNAPKETLALMNNKFWGDGLFCPSKPEGMEYMSANLDTLMGKFPQTGIDYIMYWPYDEGGCACGQCSPWGSNGYPRMCREFTAIVRKHYPKSEFILATWLFDYTGKQVNGLCETPLMMDGEYAGLDQFLQKDKSWVDYIMSDAHEDFPRYPLEVGVPGGLPLTNFPEICMIGQWPWGGYGANPLPARFQRLWNPIKGRIVGGVPYSEGIFDDMNKAMCQQFYWDFEQPTMSTIREYIGYEYSPAVVGSVSKAIELLEQNHMRKMVVEKKINPSGSPFLYGVYTGGCKIEFLNTDRSPLNERGRLKLAQTSDEAFKLLQEAETQMTPHAKANWRWRILYLRALIDKELVRTDGWFEGATLKMAFEELTRIYYSEKACIMLHVPWIEDADAKYSEE